MTKWFQSFFHLVRLFVSHTSATVLHSPYPCSHTHNPKQPPPPPLHTRTQPRTVSPPRSVRSQPVCDPREQAHAHHCELPHLFTLFHCCSHRLRSGACVLCVVCALVPGVIAYCVRRGTCGNIIALSFAGSLLHSSWDSYQFIVDLVWVSH